MNSLNIDLRGKTVILSHEYYDGDEEARKFKCEQGFGCLPFTSGTAISGYFLKDGERCRVEGDEVEKLAEG